MTSSHIGKAQQIVALQAAENRAIEIKQRNGRDLPDGGSMKFAASFACTALLSVTALAQQYPLNSTVNAPAEQVPAFTANVISRTVQAVNYRHHGGSTKIDFAGTSLMPTASGEAKVQSKRGAMAIQAEFSELRKPTDFGGEYLTYILWAISPEGRAVNLGEVLVGANNRSKLSVTTDLQAFALIVTAEPYYAVRQPSNVVVLENVVRSDTQGTSEAVNAKYELMERGGYIPTGYKFDPIVLNSKLPLEFFEARNAVRIAQLEGSQEYAAESYQHATQLMTSADEYATSKHVQSKRLIAVSRETVQTAEDARAIAVKKMDEVRLERERSGSAIALAQSQSQTEAANRNKENAQADAAHAHSQADQAKLDLAANQADSATAIAAAHIDADQANDKARRAETDTANLLAQGTADRQASADAQARTQAQADYANRQSTQAQADSARAQSEAAQSKLDLTASQAASATALTAAQADTERANDRARQAETDKADMRAQLSAKLNQILQTRDSVRGLIVNMSDVLFDIGKYSLKAGAREKLAKIAGILIAYPGINVEVGGYTDNVGKDEMNQQLSENRASSVRDYLVQSGVANNSITAKGFGNSQPVASNGSESGRQQNRRVELLVSGELIGSPANATRGSLR
jgi:outer membrane protein OmpA-like peptidoglycan-associated protein